MSHRARRLLCFILLALLTGTARLRAEEASPYGINIHAPQGAELKLLLDRAQAAGLGWVRIDFLWAYVEPKQGVFDWSVYDNIVAAAQEVAAELSPSGAALQRRVPVTEDEPRTAYGEYGTGKVAIEALADGKTIAEVALKHDVHPNQVTEWRRQLIERAAGVFGGAAAPETPPVDLKVLHAKIGQLTLEKDFLEGALSKAGLLSAKR